MYLTFLTMALIICIGILKAACHSLLEEKHHHSSPSSILVKLVL